jgi:uncharacterized protein (DUF952 family)
MLIFKIVPRVEWEKVGAEYLGSTHDRADGFLHFSTHPQLAETLRRYYAGQSDLTLVAVEADALGSALKWEHSPSRGEDFPHLYATLPRKKVIWTKMLDRDGNGEFTLPAI